MSDLEWSERVAGAKGWDGEFVVLSEDGLPPHLKAPGETSQHWVADTARIRGELGFRESVPRDDAVHRTVDWEWEPQHAGFTPDLLDYEAEDKDLAVVAD